MLRIQILGVLVCKISRRSKTSARVKRGNQRWDGNAVLPTVYRQ